MTTQRYSEALQRHLRESAMDAKKAQHGLDNSHTLTKNEKRRLETIVREARLTEASNAKKS